MSKEVVVVLNGGIEEDGSVNTRTASRVETGIEYAVREDVPNILMAGNDSVAMQQYATRHPKADDLPPVLVEDWSRDTIGNIHFSKLRHIVPEDWHRLAIVSSGFHLDRAHYLFNKIAGENYDVDYIPADFDYSAEELKRLRKQELLLKAASSLMLLGVAPKDDAARERRLLALHPRYKGLDYSRKRAASL